MTFIDRLMRKSGGRTLCSRVVRAVPALSCLLLAVTLQGRAMQALDDEQLASINGRDGIVTTFQTPYLGLSLAQRFDAGTDYEAGLQLQDISFTPVLANGAAPPAGTLASLVTAFDVGGPAASGPPAVTSTTLDVSRVRLQIEDIDIYGKPESGGTYGAVQREGSFGELTMDASAELHLINASGFFYTDDSSDYAHLYGKLTDADMFYRQVQSPVAPYLLFTDGTAEWRVNSGMLGFVNDLSNIASPGYDSFNRYVDSGLMTRSPFIDVEYIFNYRFKQPQPANTVLRMTVDDSLGMYSFGWRGTFTDAQLVFGGGGVDFQGGGVSEGSRFSTRFNYLRGDGTTSDDPATVAQNIPATSSDFVWSFGSAEAKNANNTSVGPSGDTALRFDITDWRNLPGVDYAHSWPYIGLDVVNKDQGPIQALCWGASIAAGCGGVDQQSIAFSPSRTGVALTVRDGALRTYSERIRVHDSYYTSGIRDFDWGLIYTFANVDADVYLYPTSPDGSQTRGLWADIALMSQTLDASSEFRTIGGNRANNWTNGSHLMIADTDFGNAIGMMDQSFLLLAKDANIRLKSLGAPDINGKFSKAAAWQGGIDITAPKARFNLFATFGGRDLPQRGLADPYTAYPTIYESCPVSETCPVTLVGGVNSWNYEGFLNLRISPPANDTTNAEDTTYLGYSLGFRATSNGTAGNPACSAADAVSGLCSGDGTFFATAEPGQQQAEVVIGSVTGDMSFVDGEIHLVGTSEEGDFRPKLRMKHTLLVGLAATADLNARAVGIGGLPGGATGQVFNIGSLNFNGERLGAVVIPKGIYYGEMALKPQLPVDTNGVPL